MEDRTAARAVAWGALGGALAVPALQLLVRWRPRLAPLACSLPLGAVALVVAAASTGDQDRVPELLLATGWYTLVALVFVLVWLGAHAPSVRCLGSSWGAACAAGGVWLLGTLLLLQLLP